MKNDCYFCSVFSGEKQGLAIIHELGLGLFNAAFDGNPVTPGHVLVIPKRHVQFMKDLNADEKAKLIDAVVQVKAYLMQANLREVYERLTPSVAGTKSEAFVANALEELAHFGRPPESFNDGLNDGAAAGQTVPHFHWHVMPRWHGDIEDPRGGIRHMFAGRGNYHNGLMK